jgi:hypothetical protein
MAVSTIAEGDDESSVGNSLHRRENPLREERSAGPLIFPA